MIVDGETVYSCMTLAIDCQEREVIVEEERVERWGPDAELRVDGIARVTGQAIYTHAVQLALSGETVQHARVALGGVAPVPWRAMESEKALAGNPLTDEVIQQAAQAATAGSRALDHNAFKLDLAQGLVRQALQQLQTQNKKR